MTHPVIRQLKSITRFAWMKIRRRRPMVIYDRPAFDPETEVWFRDAIASARAYIEFGSGASTLIAARHGVPTISVESDATYVAAVEAALPEGSSTTMIASGIGWTEEWGYPVIILAGRRRHEKWRRYTRLAMDELDRREVFPDLALVDGRFRRACALSVARAAAIRGVPTTILFDDYAGRPHYHSVEQWLGSPELVGRSAVFRLDPAKTALAIPDAVIAEAGSDFR